MSANAKHEMEPGERLRLIVNRTAELTPLRAVAAHAIVLAEDERTAAMDLAAVLSSDQALTARLLRLSNSAYYGYARRIANVREAVILLGMRTVRSVAITSCVIESFRASELAGFEYELFWAHSVTVGAVAEALARGTKVCLPEDAFTAGVLHDVGKLAMLLAEPELFRQVVELVNDERIRPLEAERRVFGVTHTQVGARLAQRWKFPEPLIGAIRDHHPERFSPSLASISDVVAAANLVVNREGLAAGFDWTQAPERKPTQALPPRVEEILARTPGGFEGLAAKARKFLEHVSTQRVRWYAGPPGEDGGEDDRQVA